MMYFPSPLRTISRPRAWMTAAALAAALLLAAGSGVAQESQPASALAGEPASQPASQPATEPASQPTTDAASQPTTDAASQPATEPASMPATTQASQPTTEPSMGKLATRPAPKVEDPNAPLTLNFKEAPLRTVLEYLRDAAGLIVIGDPKVEGRISLMGRNVTVKEAVKLLDSALREKGYTAVHIERTLKIVTVDEAKKEYIPVRVGNIPDDIPLGDAIITQVIPIRNADAVKLKSDLASMIPSSVDVASNASSNTLIITGSQTVVRRIVEIVRGIDVGTSTVAQVRVYNLKNANATNTAKLITDIFKNPTQGQQQQPGGGGRRFMWPGMPQQPQDEQGAKSAQVSASADDRTNTLVVSASPDALKVIDQMVNDLDKNPEDPNAVFIYHLKNVQAIDLEPVLNNVFGASGSSVTGNVNNRNNRNNQQGNNTLGNRGGNSGGRGQSGNLGNFGNNNQGGSSANANRNTGRTGNTGRSGGGTFGNRGQFPTAGTGTTSDLIGQVFVVADAASNSLIVTTASKNFKRVKAIIEDLDRSVPQVLIKVLVCEVTHANDVDLGMEFSGMNLRDADAIRGLRVGRQVDNTPVKEGKGFSSGSDFGVMGRTEGFTLKLDERYVNAALHAISTVAKLDVLSRPYILTSNNQAATIFIGENMPYIANSQITSDGQVINTPQYTDVGIQLDVTPSINPQGLVTLDVYSQISSDTGRSVTLTQSTNQTTESPVFASRYAVSRVAIRDGQTIVIGGLMEDRIVKSVDKVPVLGDIPLLGLLFQRKVEVKSKTELLIFLTPHVAKEANELKAMTESEKSGTKIVKDAVEPGVYESHLRGMRLGASTRPATAPAIDDSVYFPDGDPATRPSTRGWPTTLPDDYDGPTTRPSEKDNPTSRPTAGAEDDEF